MKQFNNICLLDGAMGTMLMQKGLKSGENPELFGLANPEILVGIHRQYIDSGSQIIYANTFGANVFKLHDKVCECVENAVGCAKEAVAQKDGFCSKTCANADCGVSSDCLNVADCGVGSDCLNVADCGVGSDCMNVADCGVGSDCMNGADCGVDGDCLCGADCGLSGDDSVLVALDIGSTGQLLEPYGEATEEELEAAFKEIVVCGEACGADIIVFETFGCLEELIIGIKAAIKFTRLPIMATMTFMESGRTFFGDTIQGFADEVKRLNLGGRIMAIGVNCSLAPDGLHSIVEDFIKNTAGSGLDVIVKANAGLPNVDGTFNVDIGNFVDNYKIFISKGVKYVGGCCGTTPEFISALKSC